MPKKNTEWKIQATKLAVTRLSKCATSRVRTELFESAVPTHGQAYRVTGRNLCVGIQVPEETELAVTFQSAFTSTEYHSPALPLPPYPLDRALTI